VFKVRDHQVSDLMVVGDGGSGFLRGVLRFGHSGGGILKRGWNFRLSSVPKTYTDLVSYITFSPVSSMCTCGSSSIDTFGGQRPNMNSYRTYSEQIYIKIQFTYFTFYNFRYNLESISSSQYRT
jgi:hypothetical protein